MSTSEKLALLGQERQQIRTAIIDLANLLAKVLLTFVTISAGGIWVAASDTVGQESLRELLTFVLSQIEFLLAIVSIMILCSMLVHAGYAKSIEDRINSLAKEHITLWESQIAPRFLGSLKGVYLYISALMVVILLVLYCVLLWHSARLIDNVLIWVLFGVEAALALSLLTLSLRDFDRVYKYARDRFGCPFIEPQSAKDRPGPCGPESSDD